MSRSLFIITLDITNAIRYHKRMIVSFASKETKLIFDGTYSKKYPSHIQHVARRKLRMLNNAYALDDLRVPPANRLEKLQGDRSGQHSIRINNQWRICFTWQNGNCHNVEIVDYH